MAKNKDNRGLPFQFQSFAPHNLGQNQANNKIPDRKIPLRLQIASFFCGAGVMILELTGSRLVAPFFGTSLIVWTALIGVMMISLCIGNWLGGYLADSHPENRLLGHILMLAAIITALTAFAGNVILTQLATQNINIYLASVFAALIIFTPSSILMGMTSPVIARLAMRDVSSSGSTMGRLSALNSAGSICGTFLGGFVLISMFPSGVILMIVASGMAFLSMLVYAAGWAGTLLLACALGAAAWSAQVYGLPMTPVGVQIDTRYNHISIVENHLLDGRRVRIMMTDPKGGAQSLMFPDNPNELVSDYTQFYDLAFHFKPDTKKILMLGGGGYCVPRHVLSEHDVSFDVVELDPGVTEAARKYFDLKDSDNIRIFHEDARTFLNRLSMKVKENSPLSSPSTQTVALNLPLKVTGEASGEAKENASVDAGEGKVSPSGRTVSEADREGDDLYDAVFMDVFGSWYSIPFQMTTIEAATAIRKLMKPDGVLIINTMTALYGPRSGVFHGIYAAFSKSFPVMMIFPATAPEPRYAYSLQNNMIVALCSENPPVPPAPDANIARLLANQWHAPFTPEIPAFTDAFAPVERYALVQ